MPDITFINPPTLAPAIGFSHITTVGEWVWLGGQISTDAEGALLHRGDLVAQFRQALLNVRLALAAANCRPENAVKLTYYVTDMAAYRAGRVEIGRAYREVMGPRYPASSLFEVKGLYEDGALVEIECIAHRDSEQTEP